MRSFLWKLAFGAIRRCSAALRGTARGRHRAKGRSTFKRTGREWAIDVPARRVVGRRYKLSPWSGLSISVNTGVLADESDASDDDDVDDVEVDGSIQEGEANASGCHAKRLLIEEEVYVPHWARRGTTVRALALRSKRRLCRRRLDAAAGGGDRQQAHAQSHALFASVDCPGLSMHDGVAVDVTKLFNERCLLSGYAVDTTELLAAMAARSSNATLSHFAADANSRICVVMPDLRELIFEQGQTVNVR